MRVCEQQKGNRYFYDVNGHTIDAAYPMYWVASGDVLISTNSADLDRALRSALDG